MLTTVILSRTIAVFVCNNVLYVEVNGRRIFELPLYELDSVESLSADNDKNTTHLTKPEVSKLCTTDPDTVTRLHTESLHKPATVSYGLVNAIRIKSSIAKIRTL